jgi:hypothetical protein
MVISLKIDFTRFTQFLRILPKEHPMNSLLDPAILFFIFGVLAGTVRSNLEIPPAISRFLSLYLLMALGLKGGFALAQSGLTLEVGTGLGAAICLALVIPAIGYAVLKRMLSPFDAAAVAATYGSVSAVTFVTATQYLENQHIAFGGHMAAAMALMESPAILMAVILANTLRQRTHCPSLPPNSKERHWAKYFMSRSPMGRNFCCWARWPWDCSQAQRARRPCSPSQATCSRACWPFSCSTWA